MIFKFALIALAFLVAVTIITRWAIGNYTPEALSLYQGGNSLHPCPDTPNCVSSTYSDDSHHIETILGDEQVFKSLKAIVSGEPRVTVISQTDQYLHAEFRTKLLAYIDDLELLHINGSSEIQLRSASRLGKSDFGVNKNRIQALREKLKP